MATKGKKSTSAKTKTKDAAREDAEPTPAFGREVLGWFFLFLSGTGLWSLFALVAMQHTRTDLFGKYAGVTNI